MPHAHRDAFTQSDLAGLVTSSTAAQILGVTRRELAADPAIAPIGVGPCGPVYLRDELEDRRAEREGRPLCRHDLLYGASEHALIRGLADSVVRALLVGAAVVVIGSRARLVAVDVRLRLSSFDPERLKESQQLVALDADEVRRSAIKNGKLHPRALSARIACAIESTRPKRVEARVLCVSTLASSEDAEETIGVERCVHRLAERVRVAMLCGYAVEALARHQDRASELCGALHGEIAYFHSSTHVGLAEAQGPGDASGGPLSSTARGRLASLAGAAGLSSREREILDRLVLGLTLSVIARQLDISTRTVKFHQANVLEKLGVESRLELSRLML